MTSQAPKGQRGAGSARGGSTSKGSAAEVKLIAENRKARFDYEVLDTWEAGLVLTGSEIKSIRNGQVNLKDSYIVEQRGELWLVKAHISPYGPSTYNNHEPERSRKLLLHRSEMDRISQAIEEKGLTAVPLKIYLKKQRAKLEIAVVRGKDARDKRASTKKKDVDRELSQARRRSR